MVAVVRLDPAAKYTCSGPVTVVGAKMPGWGQRDGSGSQEIIESSPGERVVKRARPRRRQAMADYRLAAEGSGTRVTWGRESAHGCSPVNRGSGAFLLDSVVGKDCEKDLAKRKVVLQKRPRRSSPGANSRGFELG